MYFIYSDLQYIMPFGAIIILFNLVQFLFYALRRNYYFMRVSVILCRGNFRHWQASTPIGVVLKRRADCELARKGCPVASTP